MRARCLGVNGRKGLMQRGPGGEGQVGAARGNEGAVPGDGRRRGHGAGAEWVDEGAVPGDERAGGEVALWRLGAAGLQFIYNHGVVFIKMVAFNMAYFVANRRLLAGGGEGGVDENNEIVLNFYHRAPHPRGKLHATDEYIPQSHHSFLRFGQLGLGCCYGF